MRHDCATGHHSVPSYVCYSTHGCRCRGCTDAKVARNRKDRGGNVRQPWPRPNGHDCPTRHHREPSDSCYRTHGCRCPGCSEDHSVTQAKGDQMGSDHPALSKTTVEVPRRPWERIVRELHRQGTTSDEWLWSLADKLERTVL